MSSTRWGESTVGLVRVADGGALPFRDGSFDTVVCNSVLEYLKPSHLQHTLRELDRVLRSRGRMVVWGTSNRLWPIEAHSRRWLVNYLPRTIDRLSGVERQRGLWPWELQRTLHGYEDVLHVRDSAYLATRNAMAARTRRGVLEIGSSLCRRLGIHAEFITPWLVAVIKKP
jgi:SAM-dependent methyltransferase